MRSIAVIALMLLFSGCAESDQPDGQPLAQNEAPEGFEALFDGESLDGWFGHGTEDPRVLWSMHPDSLEAHKEATREDIRQHWSVEDGELVNDGSGLYLTTNEDYGDFELMLEYKTVPGADSGVYLRGVPQVQIWDTTEEGGKWDLGADKGSGAMWNNKKHARFPLVKADNKAGEFTLFPDGFFVFTPEPGFYGTVTIEYDHGHRTFVEVTEPAPGSPYPCTDFFS